MQLDLNLLAALDALLEEESVTGAALRLRVSVPAMSRTLGRVRRATGDQILVRAGRSMVPTPYAVEVRDEVRAVLARARSVLTPDRTIDPATLDRTFTLQVHDALATALAPGLIAAVGAEAPGVRLRFSAEAAGDTDDLRAGRVDLEVGAGTRRGPEYRSQTLGTDELVVVGHADHPVLLGDLTPATYAGARHITVSRRGRLRDPVDDALALLGLDRRVVAAAPTASAALAVVAHSEVLVLVPGRTCRATVVGSGLRARPAPIPLSPVPVTCTWHQRHHEDPAHVFLRDHVRRSVLGLGLARPAR